MQYASLIDRGPDGREGAEASGSRRDQGKCSLQHMPRKTVARFNNLHLGSEEIRSVWERMKERLVSV